MDAIPSMPATEPLDFGSGLIAWNRMYFAPMGLDLCDERGLPRPEFLAVYRSLMDGGCGFGFLGNANVEDGSHFNRRGLKLTTRAHAEALSPLFESARSRGFPLGVQLQHYGPQGIPSHESGTVMSPSGIPSRPVLERFPQVRTVAMSEAQILHCIDQFAASAGLACEAGASLVQIQASNGYLVSSFLSPRTNRRMDDWGGSPLRRARLLLEIVKRVREATKGKCAVTVRLGIDDGLGDEGQQVRLLGEVAEALASRGASAIACSIGISETFSVFFKNSELAREITRKGCRFLKGFTAIPVGFTGSVSDVATANEIIDSGDADFVGFGRAVLADNRLVAKELAGRSDLVDRCRGDAFCFRDKREARASRVYCCVNPDYKRPLNLQHHYEENRK